MKAAVLTFPGSNCDQDLVTALRDDFKMHVDLLWHTEPFQPSHDFYFVPGGFSYGDYLRSGAIARFSPIMDEVIAHANRGGYLFGICNGFQVLVEAGLLPGVLLRNEAGRFISRNVYLKAETQMSLLTHGLDVHYPYKTPIAHAEGRYFANHETLKRINDNDQVLFRYCDSFGKVTEEANPNGSLQNIAGICNEGRNVFGMMPPPERAADLLVGNVDGRTILEQILMVTA